MHSHDILHIARDSFPLSARIKNFVYPLFSRSRGSDPLVLTSLTIVFLASALVAVRTYWRLLGNGYFGDTLTRHFVNLNILNE
jgi:hypothetical protein